MKADGRLFLVDGSSFCYRAFYAIKELTTSKGQPTNAVYGVVAMLRKLLEEERPQFIGVAFDVGKPTFRHRRYEAYKEHRRPMPEPLVDQLPWIKQAIRAFQIPIFEMEGYEADDILGTLAVRAAREGLEVFVVTGDKDALQLLGPRIRIYRPTRDGHEVIDLRSLEARWHLQPDQVVDVMALMGDETDAIPGVPGIGEKTAVALIQAFGSVEKLLKTLKSSALLKRDTPSATGPGSIRPHVWKAIEEHVEEVRLSYELAQLELEVPVAFELGTLRARPPDREALRRLYQELEFRTLLKELAPEPAASGVRVETLSNPEELKRFVPEMRHLGRVAVAVGPEGSGFRLGVSWEEARAKSLFCPRSLAEVRFLWEMPELLKICPNLKETWVLLERAGISGQGPWTDPCLASYLLDPSRPSHEVTDLASSVLNESVAGSGELPTVPALEAEAALRLMPRLHREIEEKSLGRLLEEVEVPLARVLARMEVHGMGLDLEVLGKLSKEIQHTLDDLTGEIHHLAGAPFNINSPKQLSKVLFETLKLPVLKRTKTGVSTDEEVLKWLSPQHALPQKILEYRELSKLSSTYVDALPKLVHPDTGRLHASFHQTVTATGRLSASNPNLQNIPIRALLGRRIRKAFVPSVRGNLFLAADYSQIELRILAHLSEDAALVEAFDRGEDIHRVTAAEIFHVRPDQVKAAERAVAKTINFGIVYGMTAFGLARELELDSSEAEAFIQRYFARYPGVQAYLHRSLEEAKSRGYCTTLFNRRRYIPELSAQQATVRQFAERVALNTPIQGSAADLIKVAMVAIDPLMLERGMRARMVCQVHDELIFETPPEEMEGLRELVKETMEAPRFSGRVIRLKVPIEVNLKTGADWFEASHD